MGDTRPITSMLVVISGLVAAACSTLDVNDYCRYSQNQSMREADPEAMLLVLGVKPGRSMGSPFVVFRSLSDKSSGASLRLTSSPVAGPLPAYLDQSGCAGIDWRSYELVVDRESWNAFWSDEETSRFEVGIAFLGDSQPLLMGDFGAAILERSSVDTLVACGCYWK